MSANQARSISSNVRTQRSLQALGITPMRLRGSEPVATEPEVAASVPVCVRLCLWLPAETPDPFAGPQARLLQHLLRTLDLEPNQVARQVPVAQDIPVLAFGRGAPSATCTLPALDALRDPINKRMAWPLLRALRRQLRRSASAP